MVAEVKQGARSWMAVGSQPTRFDERDGSANDTYLVIR